MIIFCVNDGAVMEAWAKDQEVDDSKLVTLMGDRMRRGRDEKLLVLTAPRAAAERARSAPRQPTRGKP